MLGREHNIAPAEPSGGLCISLNSHSHSYSHVDVIPCSFFVVSKAIDGDSVVASRGNQGDELPFERVVYEVIVIRENV